MTAKESETQGFDNLLSIEPFRFTAQDRSRFVPFPTALFGDHRLTKNDIKVYMALRLACGAGYLCVVTMDDIAKFTEVLNVHEQIKRLERFDWIMRVPRLAGRRRLANGYLVRDSSRNVPPEIRCVNCGNSFKPVLDRPQRCPYCALHA